MTRASSIGILLAVLVSCGGGGSSDTPATTPTPTPTPTPPEPDPEPPQQTALPNILILISDDQGKDASAQYDFSLDVPATPNIDQLAQSGIVFDNVWATPVCSPTRAALLTGLYGINNGVRRAPGDLSESTAILPSILKSDPVTQSYQTGFFGKWHLAGSAANADPMHPNNMGIDHFSGALLGNIDDYYQWDLTVNGVTDTSTIYQTTALVDGALDWITQTDNSAPWLAWVAFAAPHSPFHLPPSDLHSRNLSGTAADISDNPRDYFLASIEAMDTEIGRLLAGLPSEERENTLVLFIGDNGTPNRVLDTRVYTNRQGKGTLYEGGLAVPMLISGDSVSRQNEREIALISVTDILPTLLDVVGAQTPSGLDGMSFFPLLSDATAPAPRSTVFSDISTTDVSGTAIRDHRYKLIRLDNSSEQLFDLQQDPGEVNDLISTVASGGDLAAAYTLLSTQTDALTGVDAAAPMDITNALFSARSANCADFVDAYTSAVLDVNRSLLFSGDLRISQTESKCIFNTNAIPNHDFNDAEQAFPNAVAAQSDQYEVTRTPIIASSTTALSLTYDDAILLNGVKVDLLAAGCFGVGNGRVGCNDLNTPWRYDPMFAANGFNVDSHNAHAQSDGTYHYHGTPNAFYESDTAIVSPTVGFAADGFPIFGPFFSDGDTIRAAQPSYRLKSGNRPSGDGQPGGQYDGAFRDDWEYVEGLGDLDECNGMSVNGVYGYYITDTFPYILGCFKGEVDQSFRK